MPVEMGNEFLLPSTPDPLLAFAGALYWSNRSAGASISGELGMAVASDAAEGAEAAVAISDWTLSTFSRCFVSVRAT